MYICFIVLHNVSFHLLFSSGCKINARNILGQTALMKAVQGDNIDIVAVLYNAGITINCLVFCIMTVKVKWCFVATSRTTETTYYSEYLIQPTVFHVPHCSVFY